LRQYPKAQALMVRKVRNDMDASCIQTYKKIIARRGGVTTYGGEKAQWFDYSNGSRFWVAGLDNPGKALSAEYDFIYPNQVEQLSKDDWETLTTRCTGRAGNCDTPQIIGDCNPGPEDHWILKRESIKRLDSLHVDNPRLYDDDGNLTDAGSLSMKTLMALTGIRRERGYLGKWVGAEGQFFEEWDDERHVCEPREIPADWRVWGSLDQGYAHNTAFGLFTENDGIIYLIAEHVRNKWLVPHHCKAIRRQMERVKVAQSRVRQIVTGHDSFQKRSDGNGKSIAEQYAEARDPEDGSFIGLTLERATIDRIAGAKNLLELLGNKDQGIPSRLKIFSTCTRTIATMKRMVCDPRDPEDVLKVDADADGSGGDDEYDMFRYGAMAKKKPDWTTSAPMSLYGR
jgi:terminase large subunit-like protein